MIPFKALSFYFERCVSDDILYILFKNTPGVSLQQKLLDQSWLQTCDSFYGLRLKLLLL